jgi:hypothetical protein
MRLFMITFTLLVSSQCILSLPIHGQESERPDREAYLDHVREKMKVLEPYVGTWVRTWELQKERQNSDLKLGEKMTNRLTYKWCQKKTGLLHTNTVLDSRGNVVGENFIGFFYWDGINNKLAGYYLASSGNPGEMEVIPGKDQSMDVTMAWDRRQLPFTPQATENEGLIGRVTVAHTIQDDSMSMIFRRGDDEQGNPIVFTKQRDGGIPALK